MRFLVLILLMAYNISISNQEKASKIDVEPVHQAGLFYERLQNLKFVHHNWRIVVMIDVRTPRARLRVYRNHVKEIMRHSKNMSANGTMINDLKSRINLKFKKTKEYFQGLKMIKKNIASTIPKAEQKYYNKQISSLTPPDNGVILKTNKNLMLLNSTLSKISEDLFDSDNYLFTNLSVLWSRINLPRLNLTTEEYENSITWIIKAMDKKLDYYINNCRHILDNLNFIINQQKIHPTLLKADRFIYLSQLIEQHNYPYLLPFDENIKSIVKLHGVNEIRYALQKEKFQVEINISLVEADNYPLFRINPFPAPQHLNGEAAGFLYIQPEKSYLVFNNNGHHLLNEEDLQTCFKGKTIITCLKRKFLFTDFHKCEVDFLQHPGMINLTTCNIQFEMSNAAKFLKINSNNKWLFSIPKSIKISTRCEQFYEERLEIEGTGSLYVNKPCTFRYGVSEMEILPDNFESNIIIPNFDLKLKDLSNIFNRTRTYKILYELMLSGRKGSFWIE